MKLLERTVFLSALQDKFSSIAEGEGHCVFVSGESGIGKTSLVKAFSREVKKDCKIFQGTCDSLSTPRPLAPLHDIAWQLRDDFWQNSQDISDKARLFARFLHEIKIQNEASIIVFEDIHWADEATLDFIKFLARRITQLQCLFILTYRDDEMHAHHSLRNLLGQLPPDSFTRLRLTPLSKETVIKMAEEKGFNGEEVYSVAGGNPFYVNEILASYSLGIPDSIKDAILSSYNHKEERTRRIWDLLSVVPDSLAIRHLETFDPLYATAIERCLQSRILILRDGHIFFKHELFRRTIEGSLSPLKRVLLNKQILDLCKKSFEQNQEIERIIHHAKNANEYDLVVHYAPLAAERAAFVGAHMEASRLYLSAIQNYRGDDAAVLIRFYESYAYECYLTNHIKQAIIYAGKALDIWREKNDIEKMGNCMRFLSRLWWLDGDRKNAESFAGQAIEVLGEQPSSPAKAMAFSNMSQLKMLCDQFAACITWGEKAITIARELGDQGTLSHALNNVGSVQMNIESSKQQGIELLQQSLQIALKNAFHEHAARAYSNLASNGVEIKDYSFAKKILNEGIQYCEERDLDSWRSNMLSVKASLYLETGDWKQAHAIAESLLKNECQMPSFAITALIVVATIQMRTGIADPVDLLLEAERKAFETTELQRIIPSLVAMLEYEWLTGKIVIERKDLERTTAMIEKSIYEVEKSELAFWLQKTRKQYLPLGKIYEAYDVNSVSKAKMAAAVWEKSGNPYVQALVLFEGNDDDKRKAIRIVHELGAVAVCEKMKFEMRVSGIKSIPRGIRKTTQSNPALLTNRELDVLLLMKNGMKNKEIADRLFISSKTVDHHISSILFKLSVNSRVKAVNEAVRQEIIK